jgi:hypothetical protein
MPAHVSERSDPRGTAASGARAVVVVPTIFERRALGRLDGPVEISGPGPNAVRAWAAAATFPRATHLIVAGVAGGLRPTAPIGLARIVSEVRAADGRVAASFALATAWRVVGVDRVVATPEEKRILAERTGADIVDMESHAFVEVAADRGWRLTIVRGVSDGVDDALPEGLERLVTPMGGLRPLRTAAFVARRPTLIPALRELGRRTTLAMRSVRAIVEDVRSAHGAA